MVRKRSGFRVKALNFAIIAVQDPWSGTQNSVLVTLQKRQKTEEFKQQKNEDNRRIKTTEESRQQKTEEPRQQKTEEPRQQKTEEQRTGDPL